MRLRILGVLGLLAVKLAAQTVQPVITEYKGKADGKFTVTNNTLSPMVVLLEPKSFSISPEGKGAFRPLDAGIHVELSTTSMKLAPKQTAYVFYKADADIFPAWFTIYATFSQPQHTSALDVRIMLPHTVYLYQKNALTNADVHVNSAVYYAETHKLICELENTGTALGRVMDVEVNGMGSAEAGGFPMLPGMKRTVEVLWTGSGVPDAIDLRFEHFTLHHGVAFEARTPKSVAVTAME